MTNLIVAGIFGALALAFAGWAWWVQRRGGPGAGVAQRVRIRIAVIFALVGVVQLVLHYGLP